MTKYKAPTYNPKSSNYSSKPRSNLGQKIKNFFNVDIEKDLQEEEGTKVFQRTKLFDLNRYNLFIFLALFFVIVNILVGFNLNFLYIRQILGFLFLILIPGLLIMLCFKIRKVGFWEYLVYTIGLSVAFIMFAGLAVNWTLPLLNITDKPLSLYPILICFDLFLIILGVVAWKRNQDLEHQFTTPKLDKLNNVFFIIPMLFPVLSVLGAFILNNHGPNILTMIMLGGIAVYVLFLVIFRKRLNENIWPWAILMIFISLLLMFTLRSWFVSGWDISQEQYVFRLAYENKVWSMDSYKDPYNSCLSLSILPTIINIFLKINNQLIFKLFIQLIFIFHALTIFLIFKKYLSSGLSFIVSLLYLGGGDFYSVFPTHIRLEIAFIFFGLMILILFTKQLNPILKKVLFVIFGAAMIVSHYSTSYIALAIFTITYLLILLYKIYEHQKIKKREIHNSQKLKFFLTGFLVLLLLLLGFLWLTQMTNTSDGLISTIKTTSSNIGSTFTWDLKQSSVKSALFGESKVKGYTNKELNEYLNEASSSLNFSSSYSEKQTKDYLPQIISRGEMIPRGNKALAYFFFYLYQFIKYSIILSFIFGAFFIYFNREKVVDKEFSFMIFISAILMFLIIVLPYLSKAYTFERLFQQVLIFLSLSSVIFFKRIFSNSKVIFIFLITFLYLGYSLFSLGFLLPISGGNPTLNLYNEGFTYNALYSHNEEVKSINWFDKYYKGDIVHVDPYSELKFYSFGEPITNERDKIIPLFMDRSSYVYSNFANKIKKTNYLDARERFNNGVLSFTFPTEFLNENKNKVYNNGGSEIFK